MEREWSEGRTHREAVVVEPQRGDSPRIAPGACAARLREPLAHSCATNSAIGDDVVVVLEAGVEEAHAVPAAVAQLSLPPNRRAQRSMLRQISNVPRT